jgi:hypothetical protein
MFSHRDRSTDNLYVLAPEDGSLRWSVRMAAPGYAGDPAPAILGDPAATITIEWTTEERHLVERDRAGREIWSAMPRIGGCSIPAPRFVTADARSLYVAASVQTNHNEFTGDLVVIEGSGLVTELLRYSARFRTSWISIPPVVGSDSVMYLMTDTDVLHAIGR